MKVRFTLSGDRGSFTHSPTNLAMLVRPSASVQYHICNCTCQAPIQRLRFPQDHSANRERDVPGGRAKRLWLWILAQQFTKRICLPGNKHVQGCPLSRNERETHALDCLQMPSGHPPNFSLQKFCPNSDLSYLKRNSPLKQHCAHTFIHL